MTCGRLSAAWNSSHVEAVVARLDVDAEGAQTLRHALDPVRLLDAQLRGAVR
jgi:hypothetical protein